MLGLKVGVLHNRRTNPDLGENFDDPHNDERNGHDAKVLFGEKARQNADVNELQGDLQEDVEALPTERSPP